MAGVTLNNLTKAFKETVAVNSVNLEIKDQEFMVLVGPSGCGKSTCLRMIAGLEESTGGEIYIGDRLVNDVSPKDRDIAMVFQNYALYPHMTVYENMAFGLKLRMLGGMLWQLSHWAEATKRKVDIRDRVLRVAEMLDLKHLLERKPKQLSGGQRQRVALGRAIVREPQVFLMDEPLSNLDAKLRVQTRAELIKLHRRLNITTIYVTHDQVEAMTMGDRIVVMKDGYIQQVDTPLNLYHHPVNMFVAGFIGSPSMNFIDTRVVKNTEGYVLDAGAFKLQAPPRATEKLAPYEGQTVAFGIRPPDIFGSDHLPPNLRANEGNSFRALCEVTEPMGDRMHVFLSKAPHSFVADVDGETKIQDEREVDLVLDMERSHAFDKKTEAAVY
ncbi:MAG TPA: ABC transporter ATP-binding protein [Armatimonadota bacterium]|nr:ABC transporter ATP-binding protein [Armatimonadota bacterium]